MRAWEPFSSPSVCFDPAKTGIRRGVTRITLWLVSGWLWMGSAPATRADHTDPASPNAIERALQSMAFDPPSDFKLLVLTACPADPARHIVHDWRGTGRHISNWWPASTVKLFAAVAAMETWRRQGVPITAKARYLYADHPVTVTLRDVLWLAIQQSNNRAFDQLFEYVGFDAMHRWFQDPRVGLTDTVMLRSYGKKHINPDTGKGTSRLSPKIVVQSQPPLVMRARRGRLNRTCPDQGNCTTLYDLASAMWRVMLHERLPNAERFHLRARDLTVLRRAMFKARDYRIARHMEAAFDPIEVQVWHKPGYAMRWMSDVLFIRRTDTGEHWVVAMAARPNRDALNAAAQTIATLLKSGALRLP